MTTDYSSQETVQKYSVYPLLHKVLGKPKFLEFVGDVKDKQVLDLGCGTAHMANDLATTGAHIIGIDSSPRFIEQARQNYPHLDLRVQNGGDLNELESKAFDKVIMVMVLVNVSSEDEFAAIFRECARVLKPGGELLISTPHPMTVRIFRDALRETLAPGEIDYFDREKRVKMRFLLTDFQYIEFVDKQWTLEDISEQLEQNGFAITQLREPQPKQNEVPNDIWQLVKDARVTPHYLFIKATLGR